MYAVYAVYAVPLVPLVRGEVLTVDIFSRAFSDEFHKVRCSSTQRRWNATPPLLHGGIVT